MMDSTYSGSYGRVKVARTEFLPDQFIMDLVGTDLDEMTRRLSSTAYKQDIDALYSLYRNPELLELAANRRLLERNRIALFAAPPMALDMLRAYVAKWDIENIKSIITSRYLGYTIKQSETFLVSFRDVPLGLFGGNMSREDFTLLSNQSSIEGIVENLTRFGYGAILLQHIDAYRKENDITPMLRALDRYYYSRLLSAARFYNGDEGPVIRYFREEIDMHNIMVIIKARILDVLFEKIREEIIPGGNMDAETYQNLFTSRDVEEIASRLQERYDMQDAVAEFRREGDIGNFEVAMRSSIVSRYSSILSSQALSAGSILSFLIVAEIERDSIRTIVTGTACGLGQDSIRALLIGGRA